MRRRMTPLQLWLAVGALSACVSLAAAIATHGQALASSLYGRGDGYLMDFFTHIAFVRNPSTVYQQSVHACFPPLAYCLYALLGQILPVEAFADGTTNYAALRASFPSMLVYTVYLSVLAVVTFAAVKRCLERENALTATLAGVLLLLSNVFTAGLLERGNSAYIVLVLLLAAMLLRDSDKPRKREAALICIAAAAGLKLYPAIFGLLYVREKRWKEALRLLVYGVALFVLPFAFFGGVGGMRQFFANQAVVQATERNLWSAGYVVKALATKLGFAELSGALSAVVRVVLTAVWLYGAFRADALWKRCLFLLFIVLYIPQGSGMYTFAYCALPMLLLFASPADEAPRTRRLSMFAALMFAVVFLPQVLLTYDAAARVSAAAMYLLSAALCAELVVQRRRAKKAAA